MTDPLLDERLSAWIDGELSPHEARALEAELARDPRLAEAAARLREARDLLRRHGPAAAPPDFLGRVMAATVEEPPAPHHPWRVPLEAVLIAAAAALVLWSIAPKDPPDAVPATVPEVRQGEGSVGEATMLAPSGWRFEGQASPVALRATAEAAGASWQEHDGVVTLTLPADRLSELHVGLEALGALHELDAPRPVQGTVTVTLELPR